MTNAFHSPTHTCTVVPLLYITPSLHHQTVERKVALWGHDRHSRAPLNQLPRHTHASRLRRKRRKWWVEEDPALRGRAREDTLVALEHKAASPTSQAALCGKPRFHQTLRHPANRSPIVWSYGEGGAFILEKLTETLDISVDLKSRSGGWEITVQGNTRKEQKHCWISGWPLNVWQDSGRESPAGYQIASRCACDSVMIFMTMRIINRNRGGD